jgi:hypothetical protein
MIFIPNTYNVSGICSLSQVFPDFWARACPEIKTLTEGRKGFWKASDEGKIQKKMLQDSGLHTKGAVAAFRARDFSAAGWKFLRRTVISRPTL